MQTLRYYQQEANVAIDAELLNADKCIVKMFCGTGKSIIMRKCNIIVEKSLVVYVFPSLSLIDQFYTDYLHDVHNDHILQISSENDATTNPDTIANYLKGNVPHKIICITYQSFKTLIDNLNGRKIGVCIFDEAHHAVGETYQQLIFENEVCEKQIFFTATPKNANGVIMYDRNNPDGGMCGKLAYEYSYLRGMNEGYLNPIEIRVDMFMENTNKSIYESIARAILASGNNRVLTFHSDVNTDRDRSVLNFVNNTAFRATFKDVQRNEFPTIKTYKKVNMVALTSADRGKQRRKILDGFDAICDTEVIVISSCETIGEGIDTKNANMCVFVDPKTSYVKIIQNMGRIVRKTFGIEKPCSTILIPCWVDKTKYLACDGDREKCDEVIRQDMSKDGNFNGILNVLGALKQEDDELYNICIHHPTTFTPKEIDDNLAKQGYVIADQVGEGGLLETAEYLLGVELDYAMYDVCETDEEILMQIAILNNTNIEIHTDVLDTPINTYNSECSTGNIIRLYKNSSDDGDSCATYQPIINNAKKSRVGNADNIEAPQRKYKMGLHIHTNTDVKTLWKITNDFDISMDICSCVIDCEYVDTWYVKFEQLKQFIITNNYFPCGKSNSIYEKQLAHWESNQRTSYNRNTYSMKNCNKRNEWELFMQDHNNHYKTCDEIWYDNLYKLNNFINCYNRLPLNVSPNSNEKPLCRWVNAQKFNYKYKIGTMTDIDKYNTWENFILDHDTYFKKYDDIWCISFEKLKAFIQMNNRLPSNKSINLDEKTIGNWFTIQTYNYKQNVRCMKRVYVRTLWEAFLIEYKSYFNLHYVTWTAVLNNVIQFININKKLPVRHSTNKEENCMRRWIYNQQQNYQNKTYNMKNKSIYDAWTNFIEEHKTYFEKHKRKKNMKLAQTPSTKKETLQQTRERVKSTISQLHQRYKTLTSDNLHKEFNNDVTLWHTYHEISEQNEKTFPDNDIPRNRIITELDKVKSKRTKVVVDMGCGKAQIAAHFNNDARFRFINYDHIAIYETVTSCDISNIPLDDDTVDICILSLAMWGSNCKDYIKEAHRILESGGMLYIIEPTKRWSHLDDAGNIITGQECTRMKELLEENTFKIIDQQIAKFGLFICVKL